MSDVAFSVQLIVRDGFYFVAIKQPPHFVLLPVASPGAGKALMSSIRALVNADRVPEGISGRA